MKNRQTYFVYHKNFSVFPLIYCLENKKKKDLIFQFFVLESHLLSNLVDTLPQTHILHSDTFSNQLFRSTEFPPLFAGFCSKVCLNSPDKIYPRPHTRRRKPELKLKFFSHFNCIIDC